MDNWPPDYTLRKSARAKRASIRINMHHKIEVVVPERARFFDPLALLNQHKDWVIKQLSKGKPLEEAITEFPQSISFPGLDKEYSVFYQPSDSGRLTCRSEPSQIILSGDVLNWPKVQRRLLVWLNQIAGELLLPHLIYLSSRHELPVHHLTVRFMKSRWGSCTRDRKVTLNSQLAFLPLPLIHHVIMHELCHTRYMSHGPRFWSLLNKLDPETNNHDKALGQVQQYLPSWCLRY